MPVFRNISSAKRTGENGLHGIEWRQSAGLLWTAHAQSGFSDFNGRMQRDHKLIFQAEVIEQRFGAVVLPHHLGGAASLNSHAAGNRKQLESFWRSSSENSALPLRQRENRLSLMSACAAAS